MSCPELLMIDAGGIYGNLAIDAANWRAGLRGAATELSAFTAQVRAQTAQLNGALANVAPALQQVVTQLQNTNRAAGGAGGGMRNAGQEARQLGTYVQSATSSLGSFIGVSLRWTALSAVITTGLGAIHGAFGLLKESTMGFNAQLEQAHIAWETMLGSFTAAQVFIKQLQDFAAKTPFEFPQLEENARKLMAMGFAARDVIPLMTDIGNAAASMGSMGTLAIERIVRALGQMQTKGRVQAEEMRQLTEAGIPAWDLLATKLGVTTGQLTKMVSEGTVAASVFREAFHEWASTNFGDMMERQSHTFLGALSTIRDNIRITGSEAFKPIFERISELTDRVGRFTQQDDFGKWGNRVAGSVEVVMQGLGDLALSFVKAFVLIRETTTTIGKDIYTALQWINPFARHSPSLVESVNEGVDEILSKYSSLSGIADTLRDVGSSVEEFRLKSEASLQSLGHHNLGKHAGEVAILGVEMAQAWKEAVSQVETFVPVLKELKSELSAQQQVVADLKSELRGTTAEIRQKQLAIQQLEVAGREYRDSIRELKNQEEPFRDAVTAAKEALAAKRLEIERTRDALLPLKDRVDETTESVRATKDALADAKDALNGFFNAPIKGEAEYQKNLATLKDQIADKELRIAQIKAQPGKETDSQKKEIERIQDEIRILRAKEDLLRRQREAVVAPIKREIEEARNGPEKSPEEIREGIKKHASEVDQREKLLKAQQAEAHAAKATYDAAARGIKGMEVELRPLEAAFREATASQERHERATRAMERAYKDFLAPLEDEKAAIAELNIVRDEQQTRLDTETEKLSDIRDGYADVRDMVREWDRALDDTLRSAQRLHAEQERERKSAEKAAKEAAQNRGGSLPLSQRRDVPGLEEGKAKLAESNAEFQQSMAETRLAMAPVLTIAQKLSAFLDSEWGQSLIRAATTVGTFVASWRALAGILALVGGRVAALFGPIGIAIAAVTLLYQAWNENWGGIQERTAEVWEEIRPTLELLRDEVGTNLVIAWGLLQSFVTEHVLPTLQTVGEWAGEKLPVAWEILKTVMREQVIPTLEKVALFLTDTVFPTLARFYDWLTGPGSLGEGLGTLANATLPVFIAVLGELWNLFKDHLLPVLAEVGRLVQQDLLNRFDEFKDRMKRVYDEVSPLVDALSKLANEGLKNLANWFNTDGWTHFQAFEKVLEKVASWLDKIRGFLSQIDLRRLNVPAGDGSSITITPPPVPIGPHSTTVPPPVPTPTISNRLTSVDNATGLVPVASRSAGGSSRGGVGGGDQITNVQVSADVHAVMVAGSVRDLAENMGHENAKSVLEVLRT